MHTINITIQQVKERKKGKQFVKTHNHKNTTEKNNRIILSFVIINKGRSYHYVAISNSQPLDGMDWNVKYTYLHIICRQS